MLWFLDNLSLTIQTFSMPIVMLCKEGRVDEAKSVFKHMTQRGIAPNIITYNSLMDGLCWTKKLKEAFELMDLMV